MVVLGSTNAPELEETGEFNQSFFGCCLNSCQIWDLGAKRPVVMLVDLM